MEIQRKGLNRAFIVLAVLTVVLNLSSWIVTVWLIPEFRLANLLRQSRTKKEQQKG